MRTGTKPQQEAFYKPSGLFASEQPKYAALGVATFPFDGATKRPMVAHYNRMGLQASQQMALRFPDAQGLAAMAGARNRFTVVDIDERGAAGDRLLADVQRQFGNARIVVRTGSGGFHCYYRHAGESRRIRPDPRRPIDLIGGGPIVLPPTRGAKGIYEIVHGRLEDLAVLEPMRGKSVAPPDRFDPVSIQVGQRDEKFWPYIKRYAHQAGSYEALLSHSREINEMLPVPLTDAEIVAKCKYWWRKTELGENRWGVGHYVISTHSELDGMLTNPSDQDAFLLLTFLRRHHWGREFYLANATHESLGWTLRRFVAARARLIALGQVVVIRPQTTKKPMQCRLNGGRQ
jgi:hypothetical protein